jgi:hypothetical protein
MTETTDSTAGTDWATLAHAYGPAQDTPAHLAGLLGPDPQTTRAGIDHLWSAVLHQGTVYPATAPAVVRVAGMLGAVAGPVRADLLLFLAGAGRSLAENATEEELLSFSCPPGQEDRLAWVTEGHYEELDYEGDDGYLFSVMMAGAMLSGRSRAPVVLAALQPWLGDTDPEIAQAALEAHSLWAALPVHPA